MAGIGIGKMAYDISHIEARSPLHCIPGICNHICLQRILHPREFFLRSTCKREKSLQIEGFISVASLAYRSQVALVEEWVKLREILRKPCKYTVLPSTVLFVQI